MSKSGGNALIYVLVAIVLFGILTYTLADSDSRTSVSERDEAISETTVTQLISYGSTISNVYIQMEQTGTDIDELDLTLPSSGTFNNPPTIHKLFHPDGGGLTYRDDATASFIDASCAAGMTAGWTFLKNVNWGWSKTTGDDFFANLVCVKRPVCAAINKKITGSSAIPTFGGNLYNVFVTGSNDFATGDCAACEQYSALCVQDGTGIGAVFYNLIKSR